MPRFDVVGFGGMSIDFSAVVSRLPKMGEKIIVREALLQGGGVTANFLTQAARLGLKVAICGFLGDDAFGKRILTEFSQDEIDVTGIELVSGVSSTYCWTILDQHREKYSYMFPNITGSVLPDDVEQHFREMITQGEYLFTESCQLPLASVATATQIAKKKGVKVIFDLDTNPFGEMTRLGTAKELETIIRMTNVLCISLDIAHDMLHMKKPEQIATYFLERGVELVAITMGSTGCYLARESDEAFVSGFTVEVKDTTGAGDAFHGGLVYGLMQKWPLKKIGLFANACGAICCTAVGARFMARYNEVVRFLQERLPSWE